MSIVTDDWSAMRHHSFSSFSIQYIDESPDAPHHWVLRSYLIDFKHSVGHHTGVRVGDKWIEVIMKFGLQEKVHSMYTIAVAILD